MALYKFAFNLTLTLANNWSNGAKTQDRQTQHHQHTWPSPRSSLCVLARLSWP